MNAFDNNLKKYKIDKYNAFKLKSTGSYPMTSGTTSNTPMTQQYAAEAEQEKKSEWQAVFVDGDVTDVEHFVAPLKHGLLGKDTRLGTKKLVVRIKPGARMAIRTINAWNNEETEYQMVRPEGWILDVDVLEAIDAVKANAESQLYGPCLYINLEKLSVDYQSASKKLGFWCQISDIEWKLTEGSDGK